MLLASENVGYASTILPVHHLLQDKSEPNVRKCLEISIQLKSFSQKSLLWHHLSTLPEHLELWHELAIQHSKHWERPWNIEQEEFLGDALWYGAYLWCRYYTVEGNDDWKQVLVAMERWKAIQMEESSNSDYWKNRIFHWMMELGLYLKRFHETWDLLPVSFLEYVFSTSVFRRHIVGGYWWKAAKDFWGDTEFLSAFQEWHQAEGKFYNLSQRRLVRLMQAKEWKWVHSLLLHTVLGDVAKEALVQCSARIPKGEILEQLGKALETMQTQSQVNKASWCSSQLVLVQMLLPLDENATILWLEDFFPFLSIGQKEEWLQCLLSQLSLPESRCRLLSLVE